MKLDNKVLNKEMARQCINASELAKKCGLSESTVHRLRLEGAETRGKTLGLIARALNLDIDTLIIAE